MPVLEYSLELGTLRTSIGSYQYYRWVFNEGPGITSGSSSAIAEVRLFTTPGDTNVSQGKPLTSTRGPIHGDFPPSKVVDGSIATAGTFISNTAVASYTMTVDLGSVYPIHKYNLTAPATNVPNTLMVLGWIFQGSPDNISWDTLHSVSGEPGWSGQETREWTNF